MIACPFCLAFCLFVPYLCGGSPEASPAKVDSPTKGVEYERLLSSGRGAADRQRYEDAVGQYRKALAINAHDGAVHLSLGKALFALKKYREAGAAYEKALSLGFFEAANGAYQIAVCHALSGDEDSAVRWLETALHSRLKARSEIAGDERFAKLRENPRFREITGHLPSTVIGREEGWKYDLRFLTSEIQRLHPSYAKELPVDYRPRMESLEKKLQSMTYQEIVVEIMALVATLGDSHSVIAPFGMKKGVLSRLPLQLYAFSDGMFVIDAPDGQRDLIGSEVVEIGGRTVAELGEAMRPYLSRDNDAFLPFEVAFGLTLPDLLGVLGADTNGAKVRLKLRKEKRTFTADLAKQEGPLDPEKLPLKLIPPVGGDGPLPDYLTHLDDNFWLKKLDRETLYVHFNQCRDQPKKTLGQFAAEIDEAITTTKPRNLVIDVRLNNGGDFEATFVIVKSIIVFEKSRPDARLFAIIGRNTLSAAQNFVGLLDQLCDPIFVGEPTGSRPNHAGDDTEVVLPYSGVIGSISCAYHQTNYRDARKWIAPRIPVVFSSQAYFARKDPVMEAISLYIAEPQAEGKGADKEGKFTPPPPAEETEAAKKRIDEAATALRSGKSTSDILTDPAILPAHEWPRFRKLIREQTKSSAVTIAQPKEPGEPLIVSGRVLDKTGHPVKGALVYVYHTSAKGWYSDRAAHVEAHEGDRKHARLFGYMLTDDEGRFELRTIRPAGYPDSDLPAHIHVEVEPTGKKAAALVTEIQFDDDPRLTKEWRERSRKEGFVIAPVAIGSDKTQRVRVELLLRSE